MLVMVGVFEFGWTDRQLLVMDVLVVGCCLMFALTISTVLRQLGWRGPMEWLLRKVAG